MYICDKCGGSNVVVEGFKKQEPKTMNDWASSDGSTITLEYRAITLKCKDCGYSVTK